jgi:leucyl/phenylalanyl-tRNA---protein transferase
MTSFAITRPLTLARQHCKAQPMSKSDPVEPEITPDILLRAYSIGLFPMSEGADDPTLFWVDPKRRGIFPLDAMLVSKSLAKTIRSDRFEIRVDHNFKGVIAGCAEAKADRESTWINARIRTLYQELFERGYVHTVEVYEAGKLVGGLYGVAIGAAFFGESMFHSVRDASKVALIHLAARLKFGGYQLLDTQFVTPHLATLGAIEVPRAVYREILAKAVDAEADFGSWPRESRIAGARALDVLKQPE